LIIQEYWEEACRLFSLKETEQRLALKLLDGPMPVFEAYGYMHRENGNPESLAPVFGHNSQEMFLYPVFCSFVKGELPDSRDGSLPDGLSLEFPEQKEVYGGQEILTDMQNYFAIRKSHTSCFVLRGNNGLRFLLIYLLYRRLQRCKNPLNNYRTA